MVVDLVTARWPSDDQEHQIAPFADRVAPAVHEAAVALRSALCALPWSTAAADQPGAGARATA